VEGAVHKPLDGLPGSLGGLDPARPVAVYCKSGYRSSISSSILQAAGFKEVFNITGGFDAWKASHLPYVE
jgi:rhodanese-related sulfurtransferase